MLRRGRRPIGRVWSPLEPNARQELMRANRLMEIGDFKNAAALYEKLAHMVQNLGRVRQAAHLYVQAARARLLGGQVQPVEDLLKQGLSIFAQAGFWGPFERVGNRAVGELQQHNQPQIADDLTKWMQGLLKSRPVNAAPEGKISSPRSLPLKCPSCGANIKPNDVDWIDEQRAECNYCGSILAAE